MTDHERLEEDEMSADCHVNHDCARYSMCARANSCRCLSWGRCELLRIAGQTCLNNPQCGPGLLCREITPNKSFRCMPITELEDLRMFPDQPENNTSTMTEIAPSYAGSVLVASITVALVIMCIVLIFKFRHTPSSRAASCENI